MIRKPAVSGQFYPGSEDLLKKELSQLVLEKKDKLDALGCVSPHAGYIYSGPVAGEVFGSLKPKSTYIMLGPNHTGYGRPCGLDTRSGWKTPLGTVEIDQELGKLILEKSDYIEEDTLSHDYEHSIEVQLPFLQYTNKNFKFVPIVVSSLDGDTFKRIGADLASAIKDFKKPVTIVASSDMTHYESHESAKKKDALAIDKILKLDIEGFLNTIQKHNISMCGYAPTAIMMKACIDLGAKKTRLIKYNTSGDTSGDYSAVVGYAGVAVY